MSFSHLDILTYLYALLMSRSFIAIIGIIIIAILSLLIVLYVYNRNNTELELKIYPVHG